MPGWKHICLISGLAKATNGGEDLKVNVLGLSLERGRDNRFDCIMVFTVQDLFNVSDEGHFFKNCLQPNNLPYPIRRTFNQVLLGGILI